MHPVVLHRLGRDRRKRNLAEKGEEMNAELVRLLSHIFWTALALGQYLVFGEELFSGFGEGRAAH